MGNEEEQKLIDPHLQEMIDMGAHNISCNWADGRGGYVVTVDFGDNQTCDAVNVNRVKAYADAVTAARIKKNSI